MQLRSVYLRLTPEQAQAQWEQVASHPTGTTGADRFRIEFIPATGGCVAAVVPTDSPPGVRAGWTARFNDRIDAWLAQRRLNGTLKLLDPRLHQQR
jgi:hypothetical protein